MNLTVTINKIRGVHHAQITLPIEKGVYAIAGENGSGKSTIIACAACAFYKFPPEKFFGRLEKDSSVLFEIEGNVFKYSQDPKGNWSKRRVSGNVASYDDVLKGFFEGSLNFGNRFRDVSFWKIPSQSDILSYYKEKAADEIREQMGIILHNNQFFYEELSYYRNRKIYNGDIFFYKKNGHMVDQFHMSTGENLLVSILSNIYEKNRQRDTTPNNPYVLFLDEIEMGLHPAAIKRLLSYLSDVAEKHNYAIYISTQSIEILHELDPNKIFYVEREFGNGQSIRTINPCYFQKATQRLYKHMGFDRIILVEDDLARAIIERILTQERLKTNKLVLTLPCGGAVNTVNFAKNILTYNVLGNEKSVSIVIDADVKKEIKSYMNKVGIITTVKYAFLPFPSLEKYLKQNLVTNPNINLIERLNDYLFQPHNIYEIIMENKKFIECDNDGKKLYATIEKELDVLSKTRTDLIDEIINFLFEECSENLKSLVNFLKERMK